MQSSTQLLVTTTAFVGLLCLRASAELVAYEGFDYTPGSALVGQSGGIGFKNAWWSTGTIATSQLQSPGLTYPGVPVTGGKLYSTGTAGGSLVAYRDLNVTFGAEGTTAWIGLLAQRTGAKSSTNGVGNAATYVRAFNMALFEAPTAGSTTSQSERISPGEGTRDTAATKPDTDTWQILVAGNAANAATVTSTAPIDTLSFLLLRIDYGAANADRAYMWINPDLSAEPAVGTAQLTTTGNFTFNRLRPFAGNANGSSQNIPAEGYFDELRIGTTWVDAIPEPSSLALMGLGLAAWALRRTRR